MKTARMKKLIAGLLVSVMAAGLPVMTVSADAEGETPEAKGDAELAFTEVMFNPTFRENDYGLSTSEDLLEYIEIANRTDHAISLKGAYVKCSTKGYDGTYKRNNLVQHLPEGEGFTLAAGEVAILLVYNKAQASIGLGYDTAENFKALYDFFRDFYVHSDQLELENFYVMPRVESGTDTAIAGTFNLDNSSVDTVLRFYNVNDALMAEVNYDAAYWNRNNLSLNLMYAGGTEGHPRASQPFNVSQYGTPGKLFENQITTRGMAPDSCADLLKINFMEYNVCATDSEQKHADGSAVTRAERAEGVLSVIARHDPDVLCLTEVNSTLWLDVLAEHLYGEDDPYGAYGYSSAGCKWDSSRQQTNVWDLYNMVLWKKDKYELVDSGHFWCSSQPNKPGTFTWLDGTTGDFARCINWVILKDRKSGAAFFVLCQHIDAKVQQARVNSTALIAEKAAELSQGLPVMMSGDWNLNDSNAAYKPLTEGIYADARYRLTSPDKLTLYSSFNSWGTQTDPQSRVPIDHCFVTRDLVYVDRVDVDYGVFNEADTLHGSDHNATVYQLCLKKVFLPEEETEEITDAPTEPVTELNTEPVTDVVTESVGTLPETAGEAQSVTSAVTDDAGADAGCASLLPAAALLPLVLAAGIVIRRRRD